MKHDEQVKKQPEHSEHSDHPEHPGDAHHVPSFVEMALLSSIRHKVHPARLEDLRQRVEAIHEIARLSRYVAAGESEALPTLRSWFEQTCVLPTGIEPVEIDDRPALAGHFDLAGFIDTLIGAAYAADGDDARLQRYSDRALAEYAELAEEALVLVTIAKSSHDRPQLGRLLTQVECPPGRRVRGRLKAIRDRWVDDNIIVASARRSRVDVPEFAVRSKSELHPGDEAQLCPLRDQRFDKQPPDSAFIVFFPGIAGEIISWSPEEVCVRVLDGARTGPVVVARSVRVGDGLERLAKTLGLDARASYAAVTNPRHWLPAAFAQPTCARVDIVPPPRPRLDAYDVAGRLIHPSHIPAGEEIELVWDLAGHTGEGELCSDDSVLMEYMPPSGTSRFRTPARAGEWVLRLRWPRFDIPVSFRLCHSTFRIRPERLRLRRNWTMVIIELPAPAEENIVFDIRSELGLVAIQPEEVTIAAGMSAGVFLIRAREGSDDNDRGPVAEGSHDRLTIEPRGDSFCRRVLPVWLERPRGRWSVTTEGALGLVAVHAIVLRTGKVLFFSFPGGSTDASFAAENSGLSQLFDPTTEIADAVTDIGRNLFCVGQCVLGDGRILAAGGQAFGGAAFERGDFGTFVDSIFTTEETANIKDVHTFDPISERWSRHRDMGSSGRYYPTCATMPNGDGAMIGGLSSLSRYFLSGGNWEQNDKIEMFNAAVNNIVLQSDFRSVDQYPIVYVLPASTYLWVHFKNETHLYNWATSRFEHQFSAPAGVGRQTYPTQTGSALLPMEPGGLVRVLVVGGSQHSDFNAVYTGSDAPALEHGYIFDFDPERPERSGWRRTRGRLRHPRLLADAVLLPDGKVLIINGAARGQANNSSEPIFHPELFDPATEQFAEMAMGDAGHPRKYHSTAVLVPDGRVLVAGNTELGNTDRGETGFDDRSLAFFQPPYLWRGLRPEIQSVPSGVRYGELVRIAAMSWGDTAIERVALMRPCAVTHSVDMNQRLVFLAVGSRDHSGVSVTIPTDRALCPPGPYMVFAVDGHGLPSVGRFTMLS